MNYPRAIWISLLVYFATLLLFLPFTFFYDMEAAVSLQMFMVTWVINIPLILLFAKWFFNTVEPTPKHGLLLGIVMVLVSATLDGVFILLAIMTGQDTSMFKDLYTGWELYVTIVEVILLCVFAGWEFDNKNWQDRMKKPS